MTGAMRARAGLRPQRARRRRWAGIRSIAPRPAAIVSATMRRYSARASYHRRRGVHGCPSRFDVLGIGNAIVDVLARADDDFLVKQGMHKGGMALIDEPRAARRSTTPWGRRCEISGGSAANTIVGVASFGARAAFVGKVKDDELGQVFAHDIRAAGVAFDTPPAADGPVDGALLYPGHAGRRAHHEHLSRRRAGPASQRHRCRRVAAAGDHLSRRLSVGSAARQGGVPARRRRSRTRPSARWR